MPDRSTLARAHVAVAGLLVALVLAQAVLAGRHLFQGQSISVHGVVGNVVFALGVAAVGLAVLARRQRLVVGSAVVLLVLLFAQIGLGYSGRTSLDAASWHIPVGVAAMGAAVWHLAVALVSDRVLAGEVRPPG